MALRRNLGLPLPSAYRYKDLYSHIDFTKETRWIRDNIPEFDIMGKWKDFQVVNVAMDYCTQIERVSSLQTPLDIDLFKDFVITLWIFDLDGEYFREEMGFDEKDIEGIYKVFLSHNQENLDHYKDRIKKILDDYFEINYKNKCNAHKKI